MTTATSKSSPMRRAGGRQRRFLPLVGLLIGGIALFGCSVGSYKFDYFQEMHYQQSVRLQEPPRLSPPASAVRFEPVGVANELMAAPAYDIMSGVQLRDIAQNPRGETQALRDRGKAVFQRNCVVCHGVNGDGKGSPIIVAQFTAAGARAPADLTSVDTRGESDGALFGIVTHGQGTVPAPADAKNAESYKTLTNMPSFRKLLSVDDRWALVRHIRVLQGQ